MENNQSQGWTHDLSESIDFEKAEWLVDTVVGQEKGVVTTPADFNLHRAYRHVISGKPSSEDIGKDIVNSIMSHEEIPEFQRIQYRHKVSDVVSVLRENGYIVSKIK